MAYKSDHEFRGKLWTQVIRGLPKDLIRECHDYLHDNYEEEKDSMTYDQLLAVVKECISGEDWYWNGQKWIEK
jgi:hypothetical protein